MEIDDTDRQVIDALLADGRASARDLSKATGISLPVVEQRLDGLERRGVVGDREPVLDYDALGFDVTAILHVTAIDGDCERTIDRLTGDPQLISVYKVTGEYDAVAVGRYADVTTLNERIGDLLTAESVQNVTTAVVRETVREGEQFALSTAD